MYFQSCKGFVVKSAAHLELICIPGKLYGDAQYVEERHRHRFEVWGPLNAPAALYGFCECRVVVQLRLCLHAG